MTGHRNGMRNYLCLDGQRFGRLVVLEMTELRYHGSIVHKCQCDCGVTKLIASRHLLNGATKSCGCLRRDQLRGDSGQRHPGMPFSHGLSEHPLYRVWVTMVSRCENPRTPNYRWYGKRGISVMEPWRSQPGTFIEWAVMGGWTESNRWTVDRIDSDGPYEPSNCQMIPMSDNSKRRHAQATRAAGRARRQRILELFEVRKSALRARRGGGGQQQS
jgi:hypothetical protein